MPSTSKSKAKEKQHLFLTKLSHRVKERHHGFTRQISTMLVTGVPLVQALKLVSDNHKSGNEIHFDECNSGC